MGSVNLLADTSSGLIVVERQVLLKTQGRELVIVNEAQEGQEGWMQAARRLSPH